MREFVDETIADSYALLKYENSLPRRNYVGQVLVEIGRFANSCGETIHFLEQYEFWPKGGAWEIWIRELTKILDYHDLPVGVRKDSAKVKSKKESAFVKLVQRIQTLIPARFVRGRHSPEALATAIYNARKHSKALVLLKGSPSGKRVAIKASPSGKKARR